MNMDNQKSINIETVATNPEAAFELLGTLWCELGTMEGQYVTLVKSGYCDQGTPFKTFRLSEQELVLTCTLADTSKYGTFSEFCLSNNGQWTFAVGNYEEEPLLYVIARDDLPICTRTTLNTIANARRAQHE